MFNRPRCRDWTPLATQQLRLRNLIKITGHNINCHPKCQLYFTLHSTTMSAPFYTSEKVEPHSTSASVNWSEINSQFVLKSPGRCICIRVWEHLPPTGGDDGTESNCSATEATEFKNEEVELRMRSRESSVSSSGGSYEVSGSGTDRMLFIWGVYFSGLVLITKRSEAKYKSNSLSFQMHGGYFASPASLTPETISQQLKHYYKLDIEMLSPPPLRQVSRIENSVGDLISFESESEDDYSKTAAKSCDMTSNLSINDLISSKGLTKANISNEFQINSPRTSRSCSPIRGNENTSTPQKYHCSFGCSPLDMMKTRYVDKKFHKSEIRPSYNLDKLLQLQQKQRKCKYKSENANELMEKICMKSAFCLNLELISNKGSFYRPKGNPSMGRTLNRLLFQEAHASPEDILKAQNIRRRIETARFRSRMLLQERDTVRTNIRHLEVKLGQLHDNNIEQGSWLMSCYRNLSRDKELLAQEKVHYASQKDVYATLISTYQFCKAQQCYGLQEIYPIKKTSNGFLAINQVVLPNAENLPNDEKLMNSDYIWEPVSPLSLSVALGYVAHVVQLCSIILNLPLRNPIKHEGSRSRILDIVKELPNASREFPLYSRTSPPPKAVLYAIYLLNQNIAQLIFQTGGTKCDLRATLPNLLQLLNGPTSIEFYQGNIINLDEPNYAKSISGSSVDLNVPMPPIQSKPIDVVDKKANEQRISRSVGSYSDEHLSTAGKNCYSSEPILLQKVHITNFSENGDI